MFNKKLKNRSVAEITAAFQNMVADLKAVVEYQTSTYEAIESQIETLRQDQKAAAAERDRARDVAAKIEALL